MLTLEDIKLMLDMQQQAYKDAMEMVMNDLTSRIRQVESHNKELTHSLEFTQKEVEDLKTSNKTLTEEITKLKTEINKKSVVEDQLCSLQDRMNYQEDYSRRNNLRFDGLDETPNESWEETQVKIQHLLRDKLGIGSVQLERAHRTGPKHLSRPRTVVARFSRFEDRQSTLRSSAKLKNTNIFINEDLCEASVKVRKALLPELKKARSEGKIAYFSHTKLVIRERGEAKRAQGSTADSGSLDGGLPGGAAVSSGSRVSTWPASSVVTVTPARTLAGAGTPAGGSADDGIRAGSGDRAADVVPAATGGGDSCGSSAAGVENGDVHGEDDGRGTATQRKSKRKAK